MRRTAVTVALAVLVLVGGVLADDVEQRWPLDRNFVSRGEAGEEVAVRAGDVTVHGARAATVLEDTFAGTYETAGVWVLVDATIAGGQEPFDVGGWTLEDERGRAFVATERVINGLGEVQPDSPVRGEIAFEVARDALGDLTVTAWERGPDGQVASAVAVDIRVDEVDDAAATMEPGRLEAP